MTGVETGVFDTFAGSASHAVQLELNEGHALYSGDVSSTLSTIESDGQKEKKTRGEHCFVHYLCTTEDF